MESLVHKVQIVSGSSKGPTHRDTIVWLDSLVQRCCLIDAVPTISQQMEGTPWTYAESTSCSAALDCNHT